MVKELTYDSEYILNHAVGMEDDSDKDGIIQDLTDTLKSLDRFYLCATEIGYKERVFAIKTEDNIYLFFNPVLREKSDMKLISVIDYSDNKEYLLPRFETIKLEYQDENQNVKLGKFSGSSAYEIYTAINTLDGILPNRIGLEIVPGFWEAPEEEREEVIKQYLDELNDLFKQIDGDLMSDEDIKPIYRNYKFYKSAHDGEITFEDVEKPKNRKERRLYQKLMKKLTRKVKVE